MSAGVAEGWQLHAGDRIAVHTRYGGTLEAVIEAIATIPDPVRGGGDHVLSWETADHLHHGELHYSATDLVNRLHENRVTL